MKTKFDSIKFFLIIAITLFTMMAFTSVYRIKRVTVKVSILEPLGLSKVTTVDSPTIIPGIIKDHSLFLQDLGHQESGNRYEVVNRFGYMGKYQFGKSTLKTIRIKASTREFLRDSVLQELAMHKLLVYNKKKLKKLIDEYSGEKVHGVLVTESGLLAAAHLGGAGSVKKWFRSGKVRRDGNGVRITTYMVKFGGYILKL
tara:strand:+ start:323 stop:922 length:600 start_codon:yes stop_codon:yes gene_type:complete